MIIETPILCEALIDQGRFIGEDPIGHKCNNPSKLIVLVGCYERRVCTACSHLINTEPDRVSFLPGPSPTDEQYRQSIQAMHDRMIADAKNFRSYRPTLPIKGN